MKVRRGVPPREGTGSKPHMSSARARRYRYDSAQFWEHQRVPRPSVDVPEEPRCLCCAPANLSC